MALKQVICSICSQTVLKAQTAHIGNGKRACKSHDGVADQADKAQQQLADKHAVGRTIKPKRQLLEWKPTTIKPTCCVCGCDGISYQEFMLEIMVASRKVNVSPIPFNDEDAKKLYREAQSRLGGRRALLHFVRSEMMASEWGKVEWQLIFNRVRREWRQVIELAGVAPVCSQCVENLSLTNPMEARMRAFAKLPLETITLLGVIAEPVIDDIANRTIAAEKVVVESN